MIITLFRIAKNGQTQYYTIHDRQGLLTAPFALTVAWRTGTGSERQRIYPFESRAELDAKVRQVFQRKIKDGYKLLYSFIRGEEQLPLADGSSGQRERRGKKTGSHA